jgi:hypothetical protein
MIASFKESIEERNGFIKNEYHLQKIELRSLLTELLADENTTNLTASVNWNVSGDMSFFASKQLFSIVLEIMVENAEKAYRAHSGSSKGKEVSINADREGKYIVIKIGDKAGGILPEDLEKIFELDFSTRGKGRGLGLALAKKIVEDHCGTIDVKSEVGKGTTFTIRLPIDQTPEQPGILTEDGIGRTGREIPPATAQENQEPHTQALLKEGDTVAPESKQKGALAIVVGDEMASGDKSRLNRVISRVERMADPDRRSNIVYVSTPREAIETMERLNGTWNNTCVFVKTNVAAGQREAYERLKKEALVWNLDIPPRSLCSVTPLGFLTFSLKFHDILTRIQNGANDTELRDDLESLARIMLVNIEEEVTSESVQQIVTNVLHPIVTDVRKLATFKEQQEFLEELQKFLGEYSGRFTWHLPRIIPKSEREIDDYFNRLEDVYSAV